MIELAKKYAGLSTCNKRQVGCVVVKDNKVISYGFNHGYDEDCSCSHEGKNPHVRHAEEMALCGKDKDIYNGAVIYVTYPPCEKCSVLIEKCKIKKVVYLDRDGVEQCQKL